MARLLRDLYDPASPKFHHFLTAGDFAEQFSPAREDYEALAQFARTNGFVIRPTHPNRTLLDVTASVADVRRVFGVNINLYRSPTEARSFYAPDSEPSLESGLSVLAIHGLDNYATPRRHVGAVGTAADANPKPMGGTGSGGGFIGSDFRNVYAPGVSLNGSGQTAAVVEFDGYFPSDIAEYEQLAGLGDIPLTNVLVDGGVLYTNGMESALDIECLIAMAPGLSRVMVYETQFVFLADDVFNRIATDNAAREISCSWTFQQDATAEQIFQQFAAQGQSLFVSSGDDGAEPPGQAGGLGATPTLPWWAAQN